MFKETLGELAVHSNVLSHLFSNDFPVTEVVGWPFSTVALATTTTGLGLLSQLLGSHSSRFF